MSSVDSMRHWNPLFLHEKKIHLVKYSFLNLPSSSISIDSLSLCCSHSLWWVVSLVDVDGKVIDSPLCFLAVNSWTPGDDLLAADRLDFNLLLDLPVIWPHKMLLENIELTRITLSKSRVPCLQMREGC